MTDLRALSMTRTPSSPAERFAVARAELLAAYEAALPSWGPLERAMIAHRLDRALEAIRDCQRACETQK